MAHRFLHTLVFSSVMALEGCSTSHHSPEDMPDSAFPDTPSLDAGGAIDTGPPPFDGGRPSVDGGPPPFDGGSPNVDAGNDAGPSDPRFCEVGWQTTKASTCQPLDADDPESPLICYNSAFCSEFDENGEAINCDGCLLPRGE